MDQSGSKSSSAADTPSNIDNFTGEKPGSEPRDSQHAFDFGLNKKTNAAPPKPSKRPSKQSSLSESDAHNHNGNHEQEKSSGKQEDHKEQLDWNQQENRDLEEVDGRKENIEHHGAEKGHEKQFSILPADPNPPHLRASNSVLKTQLEELDLNNEISAEEKISKVNKIKEQLKDEGPNGPTDQQLGHPYLRTGPAINKHSFSEAPQKPLTRPQRKYKESAGANITSESQHVDNENDDEDTQVKRNAMREAISQARSSSRLVDTDTLSAMAEANNSPGQWNKTPDSDVFKTSNTSQSPRSFEPGNRAPNGIAKLRSFGSDTFKSIEPKKANSQVMHAVSSSTLSSGDVSPHSAAPSSSFPVSKSASVSSSSTVSSPGVAPPSDIVPEEPTETAIPDKKVGAEDLLQALETGSSKRTSDISNDKSDGEIDAEQHQKITSLKKEIEEVQENVGIREEVEEAKKAEQEDDGSDDSKSEPETPRTLALRPGHLEELKKKKEKDEHERKEKNLKENESAGAKEKAEVKVEEKEKESADLNKKFDANEKDGAKEGNDEEEKSPSQKRHEVNKEAEEKPQAEHDEPRHFSGSSIGNKEGSNQSLSTAEIDPKDTREVSDVPARPTKRPEKPQSSKPKNSLASRFEAALRENESPKPKPLLKPKPRKISESGRVSASAFSDLNAALSRGPPVGGRRSFGSQESISTDDDGTQSEDRSREASSSRSIKEVDTNESADAQLQAMPANIRRIGPAGRRRLPTSAKPKFSFVIPEAPLWELSGKPVGTSDADTIKNDTGPSREPENDSTTKNDSRLKDINTAKTGNSSNTNVDTDHSNSIRGSVSSIKSDHLNGADERIVDSDTENHLREAVAHSLGSKDLSSIGTEKSSQIGHNVNIQKVIAEDDLDRRFAEDTIELPPLGSLVDRAPSPDSFLADVGTKDSHHVEADTISDKPNDLSNGNEPSGVLSAGLAKYLDKSPQPKVSTHGSSEPSEASHAEDHTS